MRTNLAAEVADTLRQRILDTTLTPGERINEVELADELEVSRTPVREALATLAAEGLVENRPRRGFFVRELQADENAEVYSIRDILDPAALQLAGPPDADRLARLERLNDDILEARDDPERVIDLDNAWHLELLAGCPNRILKELIRQFMHRTRPLERAWLAEVSAVDRMTDDHARILDALKAGDLAGGVAALRDNMLTGRETILGWLQSREGVTVDSST
jgi:DNA-binding GntR family transcriptional regulator